MFLIDTTGRRSLLIWGAALQALFLFAMAGLGNKSNPSKADADGLVASVMLFNLSFSGFVDRFLLRRMAKVSRKLTII